MLMYPWQVLRGVELRADTFRLWAREHRTRWSFRLHHPHFEAATESPDLGQALCDLARVCAVMAEPFGVPAGRVSLRGPRGASRAARGRCPPAEPSASGDAEAGDARREDGRAGDRRWRSTTDDESTEEPGGTEAAAAPRPPWPIGEDEEVIELSDDERGRRPHRAPTTRTRCALADQHRVAEAEEPIPLVERRAVGVSSRSRASNGVAACHAGLHERRDQQQQRAARQVEVRDQRVDRAELDTAA